MIDFPGRLFDGEGNSLDGIASELTQGQIDTCLHRSAVQKGYGDDGIYPVALIWLVDNKAIFRDIPASIVSASIKAALDGQAILILAKRREVGAKIRDELLDALTLAQVPHDAAGHA